LAIPRPTQLLRFQSTLPSRGATHQKGLIRRRLQFQSTLPSRGATLAQRPAHNVSLVSIHAPLARSDPLHGRQRQAAHRFNPRSPREERHAGVSRPPAHRTFQSTLPSRGATQQVWDSLDKLTVSIHAPLARSDESQLADSRRHQSFNPRSPREERRETAPVCSLRTRFNPRSPREERPPPIAARWCRKRFNPRSPREERHARRQLPRPPRIVSIHAPLARSDGG